MNPQQTEILEILKEMGSRGMNSFQWRDKFVQLPVRVLELKAMGYDITTRRMKNRSVNYILNDTTKPTTDMVWVFDNATNTARQVPVLEAQRMTQEEYTL